MKIYNGHILDDLETNKSHEPTLASLFGTWLAIMSFTIGTSAFLISFFGNVEAVFFGLVFIVLAFIVNSITFLHLIFYIRNAEEKYVNRKIGVKMLINIPVGIFI